jgi:nucleoside diphosphate kinase
MYFQITNTSKKRNNLVRVASRGAVIKAIKEKGWNLADCKIKQLADDLVTNTYKELDGRMNVRGKQFLQRANS